MRTTWKHRRVHFHVLATPKYLRASCGCSVCTCDGGVLLNERRFRPPVPERFAAEENELPGPWLLEIGGSSTPPFESSSAAALDSMKDCCCAASTNDFSPPR